MYVCIYIYICIYVYVYTYIDRYIYREREREGLRVNPSPDWLRSPALRVKLTSAANVSYEPQFSPWYVLNIYPSIPMRNQMNRNDVSRLA